jgi:hypothetical protein
MKEHENLNSPIKKNSQTSICTSFLRNKHTNTQIWKKILRRNQEQESPSNTTTIWGRLIINTPLTQTMQPTLSG